MSKKICSGGATLAASYRTQSKQASQTKDNQTKEDQRRESIKQTKRPSKNTPAAIKSSRVRRDYSAPTAVYMTYI